MSVSQGLETQSCAVHDLSLGPEYSKDIPPVSPQAPRYTEEDVTYALQQLRGHLNNLTSEQTEALNEFKRRLMEAGLYTPDAIPDGPDDDGQGRLGQDDVTLL